MPVRIYALAKELKLDSKELVDLCTRIGIPNKGSALASLEDDEVSRIRKYLAGGSGPESGSSSAGSVHRGQLVVPASALLFAKHLYFHRSLRHPERKSLRLQPPRLLLPCLHLLLPHLRH